MDARNGKPEGISRRTVFGAAAVGLAAAAALPRRTAQADDTAADKGNIKQSIARWCFAPYWSIEENAAIAAKLGCASVELVPPKDFPVLKEHGLRCAIATLDLHPDPPFVKGMNNPRYHPRVLKATRDAIDACASYGFSNVISFTGMREDIPNDVGADNCVKGYKQIIGYAERMGVTLCLEMLNTRDATHPMKGHPGYQGDHTEYCIDIIRRVGSPNLKFLMDIYHVQIMDGDVIRRIHQYKDLIAHVHTAGNPGRGELNDDQEICYRAVMRALVDIGYDGYVGHEFIPTQDPLAGLREAVAVCDV